MSDDRKRDWMLEIYPDSAPENWRQLLDYEKGLVFAVSPLHDRDVYDDPYKLPPGKKLGELKKPHFHVCLVYDGKKSYKQIKELTDELHQPFPKPCNNKRKFLRYFVHLDHPEKAQYNREDIRCYGGFDLGDAYKPVGSEVDRIIRELKAFIIQAQIYEWATLVETVDELDNDDWNYVLTRVASGFFKGYLQSRYLRNKDRLREAEEEIDSYEW